MNRYFLLLLEKQINTQLYVKQHIIPLSNNLEGLD